MWCMQLGTHVVQLAKLWTLACIASCAAYLSLQDRCALPGCGTRHGMLCVVVNPPTPQPTAYLHTLKIADHYPPATTDLPTLDECVSMNVECQHDGN